MHLKSTILSCRPIISRWRVQLAFTIAAIFLTACSMIQMGYDAAPWYALRLLDRYWALDSVQSTLAQDRIAELMRWHRRNELQEYVRWLRELDERLKAPVDLPTAVNWRLGINTFWVRAVQKATPDITELFLTLRPEQWERMKKRMISENDDYRKEYLPENLAEREARRIKRMEERVEYYLGSVTDAQREMVQRMGRAMPQNEQIWYDERLARQKDLLVTIDLVRRTGSNRSEADRAEAARVLGDYLRSIWIPADPQRREALESVMLQSDAVTVAVLGSASSVQKAALSQRLLKWANDIQAIVR